MCISKSLSVNLVLVMTLGTAVKYRLTFISRSQLHRMESHFRIITLGTTFFNLKDAKENEKKGLVMFRVYRSTGSSFSNTCSSSHSLLKRVCERVSATLRYKSVLLENYTTIRTKTSRDLDSFT